MSVKSNKKFEIRKTNDLELIKKLQLQILPTDEVYEHKDMVCWIAWHKEEPVGFCILTNMGKSIAYLSRSGVLKEYRGHGLQRRMIRVRESYAKKQNFTKIITYTKIYNIKSSHNLQKCNFWLYRPEYEYADKDCLYWIKELK